MTNDNFEFKEVVKWLKKKQEKAESRPLRSWSIIIILVLIVGYTLYFKFGCISNNNNDYENDKIFFIDYFKLKCISVKEFDNEYLEGKLAHCLENNPDQDIFNCKMSDKMSDKRNQEYEKINYNFSS